MKLTLQRNQSSDNSTISPLYLDSVHQCDIMEPPVRAVDLPGRTAIPAGTYEVVLEYSYRFQRYNLRLANVPGFQGVEIHTGNIPSDTEACLLTGTSGKNPDYIYDSRLAYARLMSKIRDYIFTDVMAVYDPILIKITDYVQP